MILTISETSFRILQNKKKGAVREKERAREMGWGVDLTRFWYFEIIAKFYPLILGLSDEWKSGKCTQRDPGGTFYF